MGKQSKVGKFKDCSTSVLTKEQIAVWNPQSHEDVAPAGYNLLQEQPKEHARLLLAQHAEPLGLRTLQNQGRPWPAAQKDAVHEWSFGAGRYNTFVVVLEGAEI